MSSNLNNKSFINKTFTYIRILIIILFSVAVIYPLVYTVMLSLKSPYDIAANPLGMKSFQPGNYMDAWVTGHVSRYFINSVYVTALTIVFTMAVIVLSAYAISILKPPGFKIILTIIISLLFIAPEMTTIPNFMMIKNLHLYGQREGLILIYTATSFALGTYLTAGAFSSVPKELEESAMMDGAGVLKTAVSIYVPLVVPTLACVLVLLMQAVWSEFFWALILIQDDTRKTLMLGLMTFMGQFSSDYGTLTAGLIIATVPILLVYAFASNYFISGVTAGAIKG